LDLFAEILQSIDLVSLIKYAIAIGLWEGSKLAFKKLARKNPRIYLRYILPILTGTIFLLSPESIASAFHIDIWIVYVAGGLLIFIVLLPYLIYFVAWARAKKDAIQNWKK